EKYRSKTPACLRELAQSRAPELTADIRKAIEDAAAEIEGAEQAYAVLVEKLRLLQERHAQTEAHLRYYVSRIPSKQT
uniref:hypothetical protein n=1 Tax=Ralstonia sp. ASV6 TaxID=2795124 RepID=UPI0018EC1E20